MKTTSREPQVVNRFRYNVSTSVPVSRPQGTMGREQMGRWLTHEIFTVSWQLFVPFTMSERLAEPRRREVCVGEDHGGDSPSANAKERTCQPPILPRTSSAHEREGESCILSYFVRKQSEDHSGRHEENPTSFGGQSHRPRVDYIVHDYSCTDTGTDGRWESSTSSHCTYCTHC